MSNEPSLCPGCGRPNRCAITEGRPADQCWCMTPVQNSASKVADKAEKLLPVPKESVACYCPECLARVKNAR